MKKGKIEFLVFSDAHLHDHTHYAEDNASFSFLGMNSIIEFKNINSRLYDTVKVLNNMIEYAVKRYIFLWRPNPY
jgi:hypothetical protein